jgi:hypothetical protein
LENYADISSVINQWKSVTSDLSYNPTPTPIIGQFDGIELGLIIGDMTEDLMIYLDDIQIFNGAAMVLLPYLFKRFRPFR